MQLAAYRNEGGLAALFKGGARRQAELDEAAVASTGIPYTIVRPGALRDEPGGQQGFQFAQVRGSYVLDGPVPYLAAQCT